MPDENSLHYQIILRGQIDAHWQRWFEEAKMSLLPGDQTLLEGAVVDEAAFNGLLSKIRALGLSILFVQREDNPRSMKSEGNDGNGVWQNT